MSSLQISKLKLTIAIYFWQICNITETTHVNRKLYKQLFNRCGSEIVTKNLKFDIF